MCIENRLERLVSSCSSNDDSDVFSVHEAGTTFIIPQNLPWDQNVIEVNFDNKNQSVFKVDDRSSEKSECSNHMRDHFNPLKPRDGFTDETNSLAEQLNLVQEKPLEENNQN